MATRFEVYIASKRNQYGDKFDASQLATQFVQFFNSGKRVKVAFNDSEGDAYETHTGTIGVTTGWRPCFLLMRRSSDHGSAWTLKAIDTITAVQHGRQYANINGNG